MEREVSTDRLLVLYDQVNYVKSNYPLDKTQKSALAKASGVIFELSRRPALKPCDADDLFPLLARCNGRSPEDSAAIDEAARLLLADMRTYGLGERLTRLQGDESSIEGWRWLRAAQTILASSRITEEQRRSFGFLMGIARRFVEADRLRPLKASELPEATEADVRRLFERSA